MDVVGTFPIPIDKPIIAYLYYNNWKKRNEIMKNKVKASHFTSVAVLMAAGADISKAHIQKAIKMVCENCYPGKIKIVLVINGPNPPVSNSNNDELAIIKRDILNWWRGSYSKHELKVMMLHCNEGNKAIPLNVGYKYIEDCAFVVTTDTKGHLVKGSIKELISYFICDPEKKIGGVSGVITVEEGEAKEQREHSIWEKWDFLVAEWSVRWSRLLIEPHVHASGDIAAYRKEVLEKVKQIRKCERLKRNEKATTTHIVNLNTTEIEEIFYRDSVVEDLELAWQIHDLGYKIEHEPKATYHGYAPKDFFTQYNRFRRWYGGFTQVFRFVGPKWKLRRWWVSFTGLIYSFFWILILFYMIFRFINGDFSQLDKIKALPNNLSDFIDYTPIGGFFSFVNAFKDWSVQPLLKWWTDFFQITISEFIMCYIDFLIAISAGYSFKTSDGKKAIPNPKTFLLSATLISPIVIILNRFYWVIFGIYGIVSRRKLAW